MISDAIALYALIRQICQDKSIISALFDPDGKRLEGNDRLEVEIHPLKENDRAWWYSIKPFEDYQFIRMPVNAGGVVESLGTRQEEGNPDADYFRYVSVPDGHIRGGTIPNVRVRFMVFAYRPSDLLAAAKGRV